MINHKEEEWLEEICDHFQFFLVNGELYMEVHFHEGVGSVFRPYKNVVCKYHFPTNIDWKDDVTEVACELCNDEVVILPKRLNIIKNHVFHLYNKEGSLTKITS